MKIVVTGGAGFIGSNIVDVLIEDGHEVLVIDNLSTGYEDNINSCAKFIKVDISTNDFNKAIFEYKPEVVIHHAAQIDIQNSIINPTLDADINIKGTINVLQSCIESGVKKIIYASSAAIYGNPEYLPLNEEHVKNPLSYYGVSKFAPEMYIKVFSDMYGLNYTILRYSNAYGPRQIPKGEGGVISIFIDKLISNMQVEIYGNGEQTRDFIYVKDIACANLLALSKADNEILNISSNSRTTINDLFSMVKRLTSSRTKAIYKEERKGDILHSVLENSKAIKLLGWDPQYSLEIGLKETIEWAYSRKTM